MHTTILAVSCLLQFSAAILALRLSRAAGNRLPWILIAVAVTLMGIRRSITLYRIVDGDGGQSLDLTAELVALLISTLMLVGIACIRPWFESMSEAEHLTGFMRAFHEAPIAVMLTRLDGNIVYANQRMGALKDVSADDLTNTSVEQIIPSEERTEDGRFWGIHADDIDAAESTLGGDCHLQGGDDARIPVDVGISRVELPGETLLAIALVDLTERKQAEFDRERLFALSLDLMCVATLDGRFLRVNPAFESVLGWSVAELEGQPLLDLIHPADREATLNEMAQLEQQHDCIDFMNRYRCRDGSYRWVSWTCPAPDVGEQRLFATGRDVTSQRQREEALRTTNAELESFCYSVSHDLRAPLRHIDGFSRAVLEDYGDSLNADGRQMLGYVCEATEKLGTLIDDLLLLSRVTRREMVATEVDLSVMAAEILAELRALEPERSVTFQIEDGIQCVADPGLMRIALFNLLHNAWKYSGRTPDAVIEFRQCAANGSRVELVVQDNGAGFNPAYSDKLFTPFQRLHRQTDFPGIGVGLATVQRVIARHGGQIRAESQEGEGAAFFFTIGETADEWQFSPRVTPPPPDEGV